MLIGLWSGGIMASVGQTNDTRLVRETEALSPTEELARLTVPQGFEIQLFASEPMINKPINLAFDEKGRLWVSSTVEYPYAAKRERWIDEEGSRVTDSRDAIKILEDTDGDGRADKVTDFVDGLNIPTGVLPWHRPEHQDGCIAWSIPNIWYFADTTGDGKCDHREVLFGPLGFEKDTHGMCSSFRLGADGWVYGTHGFNNTSHFRVREKNLNGAKPGDPGTELDLNSGNVYRFRPDGSRIEIWSWGQVNPFGLTFDRRGNLYSADCHSAPVYQLLRGAHYPSFGKPHDGLGFAPAMITHTHGSTGICGIAFVDDGIWGETWEDRVLIGNVVTSRVNRDRIEWHGSTPVAIEEPDFVISEDPWFRPVDLLIGPEGALYVADFYNRIIGHYEVPLEHPGRDRERGRIWRIVKTDGQMNAPKRPAPIAVSDPTASLMSPSAFERRAAASALQESPMTSALPALQQALEETPPEDTHLRHALRLSIREQLKLPEAFESLSEEVAHDESIAEMALAVPRSSAAGFLMARLKEGRWKDDPTRLTALTQIGRYGSENDLSSIIEWSRGNDLEDLPAQTNSLQAIYEGSLEREGRALTPEMITWATVLANAWLDRVDESGSAVWSESPHPDHGDSESPWTLQKRSSADGKEAEILSSLRQGQPRAEQRTGVVSSRPFVAPNLLSFWICGHRGFPDQPPHDLNRVRLIEKATGDEIASAFPPRNDVAQRVEWDLSSVAGKEVALEVVDGDAGKSYAWLGIARIEPSMLGLSVNAFAESEQRADSLRTLAEILQHVAPVGLRDQLAPWIPSRPAPPEIVISPERRRELDQLIADRIGQFKPARAVAASGRETFGLHCAVCHQIGGEGGLIGPQLDGIGNRGVARLCEDILDPNQNVDAHFHLHFLSLKDDSQAGGFVISETPRTLRLLDAAGQEHRISKDEVAETQVSPLSLMPPNFGELLSETEFRDLLGYLLAQ